MKILVLSPRIFVPPYDGGTIAMFNLAKSQMDAGAQVHVLSFNTKKHFRNEENIPIDFKTKTKLKTVYLDASVKVIPAILNLFSSRSYNIERFISSPFENKLSELLKSERYDVVQLESVYMAPYVKIIRQYSGAKIVLRAHNIEFLIWSRMAEAAENPLKKWYLLLLADRLKNYEINTVNSYDGILPITPQDEKYFHKMECKTPMLVAPVGLDAGKYFHYQKIAGTFSVFHLGSMNWMPNVEAVHWFIKKIFPELKKKIPDIKVYLAGKDMPDAIHKIANANMVVEDTIEDARAYMKNKSVMIVPILSGSGMRVKIIEAMAMGIPVVSTTIGAEGIKYRNEENILIADTTGEFVRCIELLKNDTQLYDKISRNSQQLFLDEYENKNVAKRVLDFYQRLTR